MKILKYENGKSNISGSKIKELRQCAALSQEDLSAALQLSGVTITQKSISRIENGDRIVTDYELYHIAKILNVPVEHLLIDHTG